MNKYAMYIGPTLKTMDGTVIRCKNVFLIDTALEYGFENYFLVCVHGYWYHINKGNLLMLDDKSVSDEIREWVDLLL